MPRSNPLRSLDHRTVELDGVRYVILRESVFELLCRKAGVEPQPSPTAENASSSEFDVDQPRLAVKKAIAHIFDLPEDFCKARQQLKESKQHPVMKTSLISKQLARQLRRINQEEKRAAWPVRGYQGNADQRHDESPHPGPHG